MFKFSFSQKKAAYFQSVVDTTSNSSIKLNALDSLIANYQNLDNYIDFANYSEQFIDLAIKEEQYTRAIEKASSSFYNLAYVFGQNNKALALIEKTEKYIREEKDSVLVGKFYLAKGNVYYNRNNFDKAILQYNKSLKFVDNKDSLVTANLLYRKGQIYLLKKEYLIALKHLELAKNYFEKLNCINSKLNVKSTILSLYSSTGFYKKSILEREKVIKKKIALKQTNSVIYDYLKQASSYEILNNNKKQEEYLLKAIFFVSEETPNYLKIFTYSSLAEFYANRNVKKADYYLKECFLISKRIDKNHFVINHYYYAKACIFYKRANYDSARKILDKLVDCKNISIDLQLKVEELLSKTYHKLGNIKKEYFYFKKYKTKKDSINSIEKISILNFYQALFQKEKDKRKIDAQKTSIDLLSKNNHHQLQIIFYGSLIFFMLIAIIILFNKKNNQRKKTKLNEKYTQQLLLSQEAERKRISKDLHDSLGQTLLLINNEAGNYNAKIIQDLVGNAIEEIRIISSALRPLQLSQTTINKALENLVEQLDKSYKDIYIFGDFDNIENLLTEDQQVNLFRIVQECLSNIIKHSNAESARITLLNKESNLYLYIKDNGVGFNFNEKYNALNSLGLKTIKERVRFLQGTLQIDSEIDQGTNISITIPKEI